jgi:hypothetical protein
MMMIRKRCSVNELNENVPSNRDEFDVIHHKCLADFAVRSIAKAMMNLKMNE